LEARGLGGVKVGRGRVSIYLSCFVLSATGLAIALASALWTAQAQTLVSEALAFRGGPVFRAPPLSPLQSCLGEGQTFGNDHSARFDLVRCALPRSTDTTVATTSSPNASTTQASPTSVPQQSPVGATQPTTSVVSQPSASAPASTTHGNQPAVDLGFAYYPPGDLDPHDANHGRKGDRKVYLPNIIFPLRLAPDQHPHMNSQIWGHGGSGWDGKGEAGGSECDPVNYDPMLQRDTYCEIRTWAMPMCPGGMGHQGQDIRPPTCKDNTWEVVAVADGIITQVTSNTTVRLISADGTDYWYLHMHPQSITVKVGQSVKQGDVIGRVSKYMDGDPNGTTMHLHFQVRQTIRVDGKILSVYVPGYTSLIAAYRKAKGLDPGIGPDGNLIVDARFEIGAPKAAPTSSSQPSPPVVDQPAPNGQPSSPTAGPTAQQSPAPAAPSPAADQSAPGGQPPPPTAGLAAPQPPAPTGSSPAADQSASSGQPSSPTVGPTAQQPPAPAVASPAADRSAPGGPQRVPTGSSTAPQSPVPAVSSPPAETAPGAQSAPQPPAPTTAVPTADQASSSEHPSPTSSPTAPQPPTTASVPPQPPQSWWQKTLSSTKEWWNKLGK
jgi:Peptidase family M23